MILGGCATRVFLTCGFTDMRKGFDEKLRDKGFDEKLRDRLLVVDIDLTNQNSGRL